MELVDAQETKVTIERRGRGKAPLTLLAEPEVVQAAFAAVDTQNQPGEQANDDQGLDGVSFFLPE